MYVMRIIILFIAFWVSVSCQTLCNPIEIPIEIVDFSSITKDSLITLCNSSINRNKSIGVFGGSYSIMEESHIVKDGWRHYLNNNVTDYGKSGYGFSSDQGSIQDEVDSCDIKDIYVLWASTNDFNFPVFNCTMDVSRAFRSSYSHVNCGYALLTNDKIWLMV